MTPDEIEALVQENERLKAQLSAAESAVKESAGRANAEPLTNNAPGANSELVANNAPGANTELVANNAQVANTESESKPADSSPGDIPRRIRCWSCGEWGHHMSNCPKFNAGAPFRPRKSRPANARAKKASITKNYYFK